ncbi:MAG: helix-turn-helix domain-containing protein [Halioglobus sp.]
MDNTDVSHAQNLFAWASGQHRASIYTLLSGIGITCNFTNNAADEQSIREAMNAVQLCDQWRQRMDQPSPADAEAFIRFFLRQLDEKVQLARPPIIGRTDKNVPSFATGDSASSRSDNTDFWELHLCTEGETVYGEGARQHLIKPGQLVLIPPGVSCSYLRNPSTGIWQHFWCQFDTQASWKPWCSLLHKTDSLNIVQLTPRDTRLIAGLSQSYIDSSYPEDPQWFNRAVYSRIEALLIELCAAQPNPPQPLDSRIQNALNYIQQYFREDWSIVELAALCHLSPGRLSVLFKKCLGTSPMTMRDSLRMNEACNLLLHSRKPIGLIGEELGYTDPMHFSRRFSDLIGQSPKRYRSSSQI